MNTTNISEEDVRRAVAQVEHPEIARTLVDLGMVKDIALGCDTVTITLALPFLWVPIREHLVYSLRQAVEGLGVEVEVALTEMNQEESETFMMMASEYWSG